MLSRGYAGAMPLVGAEPVGAGGWLTAAALPLSAMIVAVAGGVWA
jgi:hypothetical protein